MKKRFVMFFICLIAIFFLGQISDNRNLTFYLSTSKIFSTGENPTVQIETYDFSGVINLKAFQILNPVEYFESLSDPHYPDIRNLNSANTFNILKTSLKKISTDLRKSARDLMTSSSRANLRDILDLGGVAENVKDTVKKTQRQDIPKELLDYPLVLEWKENIQRSDQYWNYHTLKVNLDKPGVYLIQGDMSGKKVAYTVLVISDYGLITKNNSKNLLAYVGNKKSGSLVNDYPLSFYYDKKKVKDNSTDKNGLTNFDIPVKQKRDVSESEEGDFNYNYAKLFLMGYKDSQFVISEPYFYSYYNSYNKFNVYFYTERPVYRPGQEVFFKGIIRSKDDDGNYINYSNKTVKLKVNDPRGNPIYTDSLITNEYGSINSKITLQNEAVLGNYWVEIFIENVNYSSGFEVQEYKKPEYQVEVGFDKEFYIRGNQIKSEIKATYFFGSPVANATVEYFIYRSKYYKPWWQGSEDAWIYQDEDYEYSYNQELLESGTGQLNSDGKFSFTYYTDSKNQNDYTYRIIANVTDESRRVISGGRSVKVMMGNFSLSSSTDKYVYKINENVNLKISAEDFNKKPVMTNFQAKIEMISWDRVEKWENGNKRIDYVKKVKPVSVLYGATDNSGTGYLNFKLDQNGSYQVFIYSKDSKGNEITCEDFIYVSEGDYSWSDNSSNIKIIPDKTKYSEGENIKVLIIIPNQKTDVLVTTERENIYSSQVEHFEGNSKVVEIPVKSIFSPNIFINVSLFANNTYYAQTKNIIIPNLHKFLNIKISSDKDTYKPGEKGKLWVQVTDKDKKPVKNAEISLGLVDESIYSIVAENTTDIKKNYYSNRSNQIQTSTSQFFSFYGFSRDIRKDEYAAVFGKNDSKSLAFSNSRERIAFGDMKGMIFKEAVVRKDFKDMIYWDPVMMSDSKGMVEANIKYPDNLTAWRATVRAVTKETEIGSNTFKTISRKNLMVRLETPRFFLQNDFVTISTTVHNYLNSEKSVKVSLAGNNIDVGGNERIVNVPKNGMVRIDFTVNTSKYIGNAKLTAKALTDQESDAMELSIPIIPHGIKVSDGQTADLEKSSETKNYSFNLPQNTNLASSQFFVSLSPSLASTILGSLDELIGYPYGCVEQTMSRFLPTIVVNNALIELNLKMDNKLLDEMPKMVEKGLNRLYSFQHSSDGGWGWWKDDQTDPFMTGYVIYGLCLAKKANYTIDNQSLSRGFWNIKWWIDSKKDLDLTTKSYLLFVLSFANESEKLLDKNILNNYLNSIDKSKINNYSKALLALAYNLQGNKNEASNLVEQLKNNAAWDGNKVYWKGLSWHYNWQDDEIETTAYVLKAIMNIKPDKNLVQKGINFLLAKRFGFSWNSTKQTSMVILALIDYLKNSNELNPDYYVKVYLNDKMVIEKRITKNDVFNKESQILIPNADLRLGENKVRVEKNGDGKLFLTSRVSYYDADENLQPRMGGFNVSREYFSLQLKKVGEKMVYEKVPLNGSIKSGSLILVKVKVKPDNPNEYFLLEDPIPSGCEIITNTQDYIIPGEKGYDQNYYSWNWWYSSMEAKDEKAAFFARYIYNQESVFSYIMRAQIPGDYHIMPSQASLMYYPEVRGNSSERFLKITDSK